MSAPTEEMREQIRKAITRAIAPGGYLSAKSVGDITHAHPIDARSLMLMLLDVARAYARVSISNFPVGAVVQGTPDNHDHAALYLGANIEFVGQPLSASIHGEQAAVNNALLHGETALSAIATSEVPCGHCRQFLREVATVNDCLDVIIDDAQGEPLVRPLEYFLPHAFGPDDLNQSARLLTPLSHQRTIEPTPHDVPGAPGALVEAALKGANASYAPYSGNIAGAAIQLADGTIHAGRHSENAAYNPSLAPLQSAYASAVMAREPGQTPRIHNAVLVEDARGNVSQRDASESLLRSIAPDVRLRYLTLA